MSSYRIGERHQPSPSSKKTLTGVSQRSRPTTGQVARRRHAKRTVSRSPRAPSAGAPGLRSRPWMSRAGTGGTGSFLSPSDRGIVCSPHDARRGCVSGAMIANVRDATGQPDGTYDWDLIDGYDELKYVYEAPGCNRGGWAMWLIATQRPP